MRTRPAHFKAKVDAGANGAITQYFYNADAYFRFVDDVRALGIDIPIVPGIMPISNFSQLRRFSEAVRRGDPALDRQAHAGVRRRRASRSANSVPTWWRSCASAWSTAVRRGCTSTR